MKKPILIAATIVIIGIAIYLFAKPEVCGDCDPPNQQVNESEIVRPGFPNADSIPVTHIIEDNQHQISGILTLPDPCYEIEHTVVVNPGDPESVEIAITTPRGDELCATVITDKSYDITFTAAENAQINATLNGEPVTLFEGEK